MKCEVVGWHSVQIEQWRRANTHIEQHSASEEEPSHMLSSSTVGEPTRMSNKFILSCQAHHSQSEERGRIKVQCHIYLVVVMGR